MIIRIIAIDPQPRDPRDDVVVYQVPEKSRAYELLLKLLSDAGIEYVEVQATRKVKAEACCLDTTDQA